MSKKKTQVDLLEKKNKQSKNLSEKKLPPFKLKKAFFISINIILLVLIFFIGAYLLFEKKYNDCLYPNIYVGGLNLSGLKRESAEKLLRAEIDSFEERGIIISLNNRKIVWHNNISSFDPDLASDLLNFKVAETIDQAYLIGRSGGLEEIFCKFKILFLKNKIELKYILKQSDLKEIIKENFSDLENPLKEASLAFLELETSSSRSLDLEFFIEEESLGQEIDYQLFFQDFNKRISSLNNEEIVLRLIESHPQSKKDDLLGLEIEAYEKWKKLKSLNLSAPELKKNFEINSLELASWLAVLKNSIKEKYEISLNEARVKEFLEEEIASQVNREALRPQIEMQGERVKIFEPGRNGLFLNINESFLEIKKIIDQLDQAEDLEINLIFEVEEIEKLSSDNDLGIIELIGTGHSNFAGSPANRRHNIKVGADKLHGLIVKPGEEFSLVKAIGLVDKSTGYLPELVIKGNKTIPEYGGGLCQIATTMFRSALGTGLPITERRNHSYRVVYYEPAGTDASMYDPHPDLKFVNDTGNNILIQARFEGVNDIYFDFWGKSDGRIVSTTPAVIYNIVKPGPGQIIESLDLPPGEKKCTEKAIAGADAYFDYIVVYNSGQENEKREEKRFYSKYVPWREVCLLGVEKEETEKEEGEENEEENLDENDNINQEEGEKDLKQDTEED